MMKNLELLYAQIQDRGMSWETYQSYTCPMIKEQGMFKLESKNDQTGWVLKSDDGSFHVWFMTRSIDGSLYYVVETGQWHPNQLHHAMNDLMLEMRIRCQDMIERCGEPA